MKTREQMIEEISINFPSFNATELGDDALLKIYVNYLDFDSKLTKDEK